MIVFFVRFPFHKIHLLNTNVCFFHFLQFLFANRDHLLTHVNSLCFLKVVGNLEEDLAGAGGDVKVLVFEGEFLERFADEVERVLGSELVVLCPLCVEAKQIFFHLNVLIIISKLKKHNINSLIKRKKFDEN